VTRIAVIGAGLSGLAFAQTLADDAQVRVFEKSRGFGGRMATRRHDPFQFDHGAQFFTAKSKTFQAFLEPYLEQGVVARWDARFVELEGGRVTSRRSWSDEHPRYVGVPGMNAFGSALGENLDVRLDTRVGEISRTAGAWRLLDTKGHDLGRFDWVVSSVPTRQAMTLLPALFAHRDVINNCDMPGGYTLMLGFNAALALDWDAALVKDGAVSWISVNSSKPGRDGAFSLVVQASNNWAEANMELDERAVIAHLLAETGRAIGQDASLAEHIGLHRWRYANPGPRQGAHSLIDSGQRLAAIGDWCIRGRVESAFLSGLDAAQKIRSL
jgi:renalase